METPQSSQALRIGGAIAVFAIMGGLAYCHISRHMDDVDAIAAGRTKHVSSTAQQSTDSRERTSTNITKEKYQSVKTDMTYEQVEQILGSSGDELGRSEIAGVETVMYMWQNKDGSNMNAMFQNGKLAMKSQFGLP